MEPTNSYIVTKTGKHVNPLNFIEHDFCIGDVAHALAHLCRFAGHTKHFYSVAQHCTNACIVALSFYEATDALALSMLLHDAAEAYTGDIIRPIKALAPNQELIADDITAAIMKLHGLEQTWYENAELLHVIDNRLCATESALLMLESMPKGYESYSNDLLTNAIMKEESFALARANYRLLYNVLIKRVNK